MQVDRIVLKHVGPFEDARIDFPAGENPDLADVYLLTGPNGSGKSTVLFAIASIIGSGQGNLGVDLGARRLRSPDSVAALAFDGQHRAVAWRVVGSKNRPSISDPLGDCNMRHETNNGPIAGSYRSPSDHPIHQYWQQAREFQVNVPKEACQTFSWAAFAYAGMRSVDDAQVSAIQEPTYSPFENSLSFINTANTQRLAQWIANQDFKRLKAKEAGRLDRADQLDSSIRNIERVVGEIVGEEFAFVTGDDDNNVRVRRNGDVVDLGLLPDGLKSIVSWIADLLMRLDRIPWAEEIPTMHRQFLLLLDEVDIHLHPTWQRKVLPIVQRMFPNSQIIASTHSPFVVASADDARIITLKLKDGISSVEHVADSQVGISYSAVLRSIFGIDSEFDVDTEKLFKEFHAAKHAYLSGLQKDRVELDRLAGDLSQRSEEVNQLVAIELRQIGRSVAAK